MRPLREQVDSTIAVSDPVRRNLLITLTYHRILHAMTPLVGTVDVSWPAYAVWASRTAGHHIRAEDLPAVARRFMDETELAARFVGSIDAHQAELGALLTLPATFLHAAIEQVLAEIPKQLGEGNRLVFEDLGPAYVSFIEAFAGKENGDPATLQAYLQRYRPGPSQDGGQTLLAEAFTAYHEAMRTEHPQERAEWMLLGNLTTGYHEQIRLQGPIAASLDIRLADQVTAHLETTGHGVSAGLLKALVRVAPRILDEVEEAFRVIATEHLMTLKLPDVEMRLGDDVPPLPDGRDFPLDVTRLTNPKVLKLLAELDHTPDRLQGSRAHDWSRLSDRMNFIVDVFRSRQQHSRLFEPPFDAEQIADIDAGRMPSGPLF
jgi:hypothetical protein